MRDTETAGQPGELSDERKMEIFSKLDAHSEQDAATLRINAEGGYVDALDLITARHAWRAFEKAARAIEAEVRATLSAAPAGQMPPKRFDFGFEGGRNTMLERPDGAWVRYGDVRATLSAAPAGQLDRATVIRLAREASNGDGGELSGDAIERFAQLVFLSAATLAGAPAGQLPSYHPDSLLAKQVKLGYRWRGKACPCGDCQSPECQAAGCAWENDPSLVPVKERIPLAPAPIQPQPELLAETHAQIRHLIDDLTDAVDDGGLVRYVPRQNLTFSNCIAALIPLADRMRAALSGAASTPQPEPLQFCDELRPSSPLARAAKQAVFKFRAGWSDDVATEAVAAIDALDRSMLGAAPTEAVQQPDAQTLDDMNGKLCGFSNRWALDGDYLRCRKCKRPQITNYRDSEFQHAAGCKAASTAEKHPWRTLIELLRPLYATPPSSTGPWDEARATQAAHAAGFAGDHWMMGPEELSHLLTTAGISTGHGAAAVGGVPEGFKLVPVEPTPEMLLAARKIPHPDREPCPLGDGYVPDAASDRDGAARWRAMLSASPATPAGEKHPTADECKTGNVLLDKLMADRFGTTQWPENWLQVRAKLIEAQRLVHSVAPQNEDTK